MGCFSRAVIHCTGCFSVQWFIASVVVFLFIYFCLFVCLFVSSYFFFSSSNVRHSTCCFSRAVIHCTGCFSRAVIHCTGCFSRAVIHCTGCFFLSFFSFSGNVIHFTCCFSRAVIHCTGCFSRVVIQYTDGFSTQYAVFLPAYNCERVRVVEQGCSSERDETVDSRTQKTAHQERDEQVIIFM